ncbi:MAG: uroporphyrinogen decarboxylase family protein, partial [Bacillota bacterium]|nr:uroporphyrinogen decarboxylase family protein [Bacillota bacterium]
MEKKAFNYNLADSQGTIVKPIEPKLFDFVKYQEYEAGQLEQNRKFWSGDAGVAVYRRFRAPEVFSYGCKDMKQSLALQLGALNKSISYKMDVANFLEPWYGIGTIGSAFGLTYEWHENQAPATKAAFKNVKEAVAYPVTAVDKTDIGRHTLEMIEYFMDQTKGKLPVSFTDTQSPLNIAASLVDINQFFMDFYENPAELQQLLDLITDLLIDFTKKQRELIGDALALPGHGFSSSREFTGVGMSDDMMIMLSP